MIALMTSCASGKIVLSNNANISNTSMSFSGKKHLEIENWMMLLCLFKIR